MRARLKARQQLKAMLRDESGWRSVVHDGALANAGMIGFSRWLDAAGVEAVHA